MSNNGRPRAFTELNWTFEGFKRWLKRQRNDEVICDMRLGVGFTCPIASYAKSLTGKTYNVGRDFYHATDRYDGSHPLPDWAQEVVAVTDKMNPPAQLATYLDLKLHYGLVSERRAKELKCTR